MARVNSYFIKSLLFSAMIFQASLAYSVQLLDIAQAPLYLGKKISSNVVLVVDNSSSMSYAAYYGATFDPEITYYGIFSATKNYEYDFDIPVDTSAYSVTIDSSVKGAFKESNCEVGSGNDNCWSGNLLNWLTTRRIDALRKALVGGKVENREGYDYLGNGGRQFKIVGNNQVSDYRRTPTIFRGNDVSQYSPLPDMPFGFYNSSPAAEHLGSRRSRYEPYPRVVVDGYLRDVNGEVVALFGTAKSTSDWEFVRYYNVFDDPVIVATVQSNEDSSPGVIQTWPLGYSFWHSFRNWSGQHSREERMAYIVAESGYHELSDGRYLVAGEIETRSIYQHYRRNGSCRELDDHLEDVSFGVSMDDPVVVASVYGRNFRTVGVRISDINNRGFKFGLMYSERDHPDYLRQTEKVSFVALNKGLYRTPMFTLDVGYVDNVRESLRAGYFSSDADFKAGPDVITTLQTINDPDVAAPRVFATTRTSIRLQLQEETTCDGETQREAGERVGYFAFEEQPVNIALVVENEPKGIFHEIINDVRLGLSFFRYDPGSPSIYNFDRDRDREDAATFNIVIPENPFVANIYRYGGYRTVSGHIGSDVSSFVEAIEKYPVRGITPLAESLWEMIQYFEQDPNGPYYDPVSGIESFNLADAQHPELDPFYDVELGRTVECIRSHVVLLTDGVPNGDGNIPSLVSDYDEDNNQDDGYTSDVEFTDNLDDVAYWGFCDKSQGSCMEDGEAVNPSRDLRSDIDGLQYLRTHVISFGSDRVPLILEETARNGGGKAFAAKDGAQLADALRAILDQIVTSSAASVAVNAGSLRTDAMLFLARFNSGNWTGSVHAYKLNPDGTIAHELDEEGLMIPDSNGWTSSIPQSRVIVSYNSSTNDGIPFQWERLSDEQKALIDSENVNSSQSDLFDYLRGSQDNETQNEGVFRRRVNLLGDIIHSAPVYVGAPAFHYPDDLEDAYYSAFKRSKRNRTPMVYVGANDGMMHAFNAETGVEAFAYVPSSVYKRLSSLAEQTYAHKYFVDGRITVIDAFFGNAWHSVLVGGLRGGGQGIYALDVTDPSDWSSESAGATKVLWEFTDAQDADLGYTFSRPNIVRLQDGNWAAIFGNGYNNIEDDGHASTTGNAVLYIVKLADGSLLKKIDTGVGFADGASGDRPNGLATVAPVDVDGDSIVDYVYGGDLYGNMWKFDLTSTSASAWGVANNGEPLYIACSDDACTNTNRQPITVRPEVSRHPLGEGYLVFFGTGKYFEEDDNRSTHQQTQTFYAIWDKGESFSGRAELKERKVLSEVIANGNEYRITSGINSSEEDGGGAIDWNSQKGWFIDLEYEGSNNGERVVADPLLRGDRVIFTTLVPSEDPCTFGGDSWLMELSSTTGTHLDLTPFDVNGDGTFDVSDHLPSQEDVDGDGNADNVAASGTKSGEGILAQPAIVSADPSVAPDKEYKYLSGSSGNVQRIEERSGGERTGRVSWRQLK